VSSPGLLAGRGRGARGPAATFQAPAFELRARVGPETVIALGGELDIAAAAQLERTLTSIDLTAVRRLTLDLSSLEFMDAIGMRALFRVRDVCLERSVTLTVLRGPRAVQRLFQLTNTEGLLPFEPA
jgi:anti-sigma B factor antagonist